MIITFVFMNLGEKSSFQRSFSMLQWVICAMYAEVLALVVSGVLGD